MYFPGNWTLFPEFGLQGDVSLVTIVADAFGPGHPAASRRHDDVDDNNDGNAERHL